VRMDTDVLSRLVIAQVPVAILMSILLIVEPSFRTVILTNAILPPAPKPLDACSLLSLTTVTTVFPALLTFATKPPDAITKPMTLNATMERDAQLISALAMPL